MLTHTNTHHTQKHIHVWVQWREAAVQDGLMLELHFIFLNWPLCHLVEQRQTEGMMQAVHLE